MLFICTAGITNKSYTSIKLNPTTYFSQNASCPPKQPTITHN